MRVRSAVLALLSSSPLFVLAMIGVIGRTQQHGWKFEEYSPRDQHILRSYRQAGLQTMVLQERFVERSPENVSDMLAMWMHSSQEAGTTSLPMMGLADQGQFGPKLDLMLAKGLAVNMGLHAAQKEAAEGNSEQAVETLLDCIAIAQIGRDGGFNCLIDSSRDSLPLLSALAGLAPQLSEADRMRVLGRLNALDMDKPLVDEIFQRMSRLKQRRGSGESWEPGVIVANASDGHGVGSFRQLIVEAQAIDPGVSHLAELARIHEEYLHQRLDAVSAALLNP